MINSYRATRAEASDVANSIFDGSDVIMLSGETASGKYPLEAVQTMAKIAVRTENALDYVHIFQKKGISERIHSTDAISHATVQISQEIKADTILTITESGFTARMIAKYKPQCTVVAVSRLPERVRAMQLYWGVLPLLGPYSTNTDEMIELSLQCALHHSVIKDGASVVITAGVPIGTPGSTNLIKVVTVGTKLLSGTGIGSKTVTGRICVGRTAADFKDKLQKGDILVVDVLNDEFVPQAAAKAAAIIAEEGGLTSSTAIVAVTCGLPVIVGAEKATSKLADGLLVTVDPVSVMSTKAILTCRNMLTELILETCIALRDGREQNACTAFSGIIAEAADNEALQAISCCLLVALRHRQRQLFAGLDAGKQAASGAAAGQFAAGASGRQRSAEADVCCVRQAFG